MPNLKAAEIVRMGQEPNKNISLVMEKSKRSSYFAARPSS